MAYTNTKTIYGTTLSPVTTQDIKGKFFSKKGFGFPVGSKVTNGHPFFHVESNETLIKNNLKQLLTTEPGERVMLPDFGCGLRKYLFEPLDNNTIERIKNQVIKSITQYLDSVLIEDIQITEVDEVGKDHNQVIDLKLRLRVKDETNLVFYTEVKIS
jgi:phage baseplate assembly protein W|tara:strand:+ start:12849 stop:13319 length:471 start_codon:yes stop_codon:yes gene_type:complete